MVVRQIAGVLARRIVCRVRPGDKIASGEVQQQFEFAVDQLDPSIGFDQGRPVRKRLEEGPELRVVDESRAQAAVRKTGDVVGIEFHHTASSARRRARRRVLRRAVST